MKAILLILAMSIVAMSFAQTTGANVTTPTAPTVSLQSTWAGAEFFQRKETDTIVLYTLKSYTPFKNTPKLTLNADSFAGYSTTSSDAVMGLGLVLDYALNSTTGVVLGLGDIVDLSKEVTFSSFAINKAGLILGGRYSFGW